MNLNLLRLRGLRGGKKIVDKYFSFLAINYFNNFFIVLKRIGFLLRLVGDKYRRLFFCRLLYNLVDELRNNYAYVSLLGDFLCKTLPF